MLNEAIATPPEPVETREEITFSATGGEYFRIWIVNLLLTIVTLGIYSAWAKVRSNQYFYSNTRIAGSSFEYHGQPIAILKGRLIAFALFGGYNIAFQFSAALGFAIFGAMALVMPWLLWRSSQFSMYNSSYRGIRFGFDGSAGQAYKAYLGGAVLTAISFGLLAPFAHQRIKRFQYSEARFGNLKFGFDAPVKRFYGAWLLYILALFAAMIVMMVVMTVVTAATLKGGQPNQTAMIAIMVLIYPLFLSVGWLFAATIYRLVWNHTQLGGQQFESSLQLGRMLAIYATNTFAILFTLGLYTPFAKVRAMKYRLESISLLATSSFDSVVAAQAGEVNATGEGMADILGIDLSI